MKLFIVAISIAGFVVLQSCNESNTNAQANDQTKNLVTTNWAEGNAKKAITTGTIKLTTEEFKKKVFNYIENPNVWKFEGDLPCIVDFYADWCAPCRMTLPILEDLAIENAGKINIYKVDIQKEQELAMVFGIQGIPAFLFCPKEGQPVMSNGIARTAEETKQLFRRQIGEYLLKE